MKFIFPETKSCCFCISLRYGLLIWGLLKLLPGVALLMYLIDNVIMYIVHDYPIEVVIEMILATVFNIVDFCVTVAFIYATYKSNLKLLKLYFHYSLAVMIMFLYCFIISSESEMANVFASVITDAADLSPLSAIVIHTLTFFLQAYLIVLVNSMIEDLKRAAEVTIDEDGKSRSTVPIQSMDEEKY